MSTLVTGSKCRLCSKTFRGPEEELGGAMIVGEKPAERVGRYIGKLIKHLQEKHPEQSAYLALQSQEYLGLVCLMNFETSDELVAAERDRMRWLIHKATRRAKVTDERIREKSKVCVDAILKDLNLDLSQNARVGIVEEHVSALLIQMRDVLEERGMYKETPAPPRPSDPQSPSTQPN